MNTAHTPPMARPPAPPLPRSGAALWFVLVTVLVVYGSLIPLEYVPLPWDTAVQRFARAPWLQLNADKRADWVANGLAYLPIGGLAALALLPQRAGPLLRLLCAALAATGVAALAVGVEFLQVYFPKRTVSLNDMAAEIIGGSVGAFVGATVLPLVWPRQGWWSRLHLNARTLGLAYTAAIVALGLFPLDLIISAPEWAAKLSGTQVGWWVAGSPSTAKLLGSLALEILASAPLALALHAAPGAPVHRVIIRAALAGGALGLAMEFMQLAMVSTISQGISVFTRALGASLGMVVVLLLGRLPVEHTRLLVRRMAWVGVPVHLAAILVLSAGWNIAWVPFESAMAMLLHEVRFLPFYYHYYVSEQQAMASTVKVAALYAPIGLWAWALRPQAANGTGGLWAAAAAVGCCLLAEAARLMAGLRPDPSNLIIAAAAAASVAAVLQGLSMGPATGMAGSNPENNAPSHNKAPPPLKATAASNTAVAGSAVGVLALVLICCGPWGWPLITPIVIGATSVAVYFRPLWAPGFVAALAMLFDPRPWAPASPVGEFDVVLAAILCAAVCSTTKLRPSLKETEQAAPGNRLMVLVLLLSALSGVLATSITVVDWAATGLPFNTEPLGPARALEACKGVLWGCLFLAWARWAMPPNCSAALLTSLRAGTAVGLVGTAAVMLWEWMALGGQLSQATPLRLSGPLQDMSIGGSSNEALLVIGVASCAGALVSAAGPLRRLLWLGALVVGACAMVLSYSRAAHLALALMLATFAGYCLLQFFKQRWATRSPASSLWPVLAAAGGAAACGLVGWLAILHTAGPGATDRLKNIQQEVVARFVQPQSAWKLHDSHLGSVLFGMGWASYPAKLYGYSLPNERVMMYAAARGETSQPQIVLAAGDTGSVNLPLMLPSPISTVTFHARWAPQNAGQAGAWQLLVCRKWLLNSSGCAGHTFRSSAGGPGNPETTETVTLDISGLAGSGAGAQLPLMVALHHPGDEPVVISSLKLTDGEGQQELVTGSWRVASDSHIAWKIQSAGVSLAWERGLLGVCAALVWLLCLWRVAQASPSRIGEIAILLVGLVCAGAWDTFTHSGRVQLLMLLALLGPQVVGNAICNRVRRNTA